MYTAFLYGCKNAELRETIKYYCKKYCIDVFEIKDLREMMLKGSVISKYALFVDTQSVDISSDLLDFMLKQNGNPKLIGVILISKENYENKAIDNELVYNVTVGEGFIKDFVSKADKLRDNRRKTIQTTSEDISNVVYEFLLSTKLLSKYAGFGYIKEALVYCLAQMHGVDKLTTKVYPYIASNNKTTVNNVERNIRIAIECSWKNNGSLTGFSKKPSNKEFLTYAINSILQKIQRIV